MPPLACFPTCPGCTGAMEWNEKLGCWVCHGCEETVMLLACKLPPRKTIPKAGILAQLHDGERAP